MLRATKVRIYPTQEQAEFLIAQFGAVRFAYNKALHIKNHFYRQKGVSLSPQKDLKPLLAVGKKSRKYDWLKQFDSIALQEAVRHLHGAFTKFFDKSDPARYPKFKRKHGRQSSYHCTGIKVLDGAIKLPKIKQPIKARLHREIEGKLKSITVSRSATGCYYASILVDDGQEAPAKAAALSASEIMGVDMGLTHISIKSDGDKEENPRFLLRAARNLRRKQKAFSRKKKGSKSRAKARLLVAKCHERVANARNDFQHNLSRTLIDENQAVIVETLKVKNMLQNARLAKHIADAAWGELLLKLEYKAAEAGKHLVKIDPWFASSKTCSCCGEKRSEMPLNIRTWSCTACGAHHDRDINAALNIKHQGILKLKAEGLSVSADGGKRNSSTMLVAV